jgi:hypothetical protein
MLLNYMTGGRGSVRGGDHRMDKGTVTGDIVPRVWKNADRPQPEQDRRRGQECSADGARKLETYLSNSEPRSS